MSETAANFTSALNFNSAGLIPVVVQEANSKEVLMLAWMNIEAVTLTIETSAATYWSRSRNELWVKGQTSGNTQEVVAIAYDCDADTILLTVNQNGAACHTGDRTCFDQHRIEPS
ncbi:MAG: phosphoribosyl-AMP cyclohydrolase [Actinobacteria bacterium]|nr:phosphoribosyl-AMP cyclohydrolase [Actinomycetota bacterium]NBX78841.1 phosphoribosyl-AMP cyclohydrolase [Flavobacteriales bacterium]